LGIEIILIGLRRKRLYRKCSPTPTGREALAHPADEKALATLWNDSVFDIE